MLYDSQLNSRLLELTINATIVKNMPLKCLKYCKFLAKAIGPLWLSV